MAVTRIDCGDAFCGAEPCSECTTGPEEWIKTMSALEMLVDSPGGAQPALLRALPHKAAPPIEGVPGRRPTLYRLSDIERVAKIMRECSVTAAPAIRIVAAELEGRI